MSGTPNPSVSVGFGNGNSAGLADLATDVMLFLGPAAGGGFLRPRRVSSDEAILNFLYHGPLTGQLSHHVNNSQAAWGMRARASTPGSSGGVTTRRASTSVGSLSVGVSTHELHAVIPATGAALSVASGWVDAPSPLHLDIVGSAALVETIITINYIDENGNPQTEAKTMPLGGGTVSTTGYVARVTSITTNVDPVGTLTFQVTYSGPQDRYDFVWEFQRGNVLSGGLKQPNGRWSMDGGRTWSRTLDVPATGIVDIETYKASSEAATGLRLTFASNFSAPVSYGSIRTDGADDNGDLLFTGLKSTSTITIAIAGTGTALSISLVGDAVTINCATDGGGLCTTTAAALYAFWNGSNANAIAARLRWTLHAPVGTGASLLAAVTVKSLTNCNLTLTPRVEGVRFQLIESGVSQARSVTVTGSVGAKLVTVYLDTDVNGILTSTAANIVALLAGDATASQYITAVASGSGAGLTGAKAPISFNIDFNTSDRFSFQTTPPSMTNADIDEALTVLTGRDDVLEAISTVVIVKDGLSDADLTTFETWIANTETNKKVYLTGIASTAFQTSTSENPTTQAALELAWADAIISTYTQRTTAITLIGGEVDTFIPLYAAQPKRNKISSFCARDAICPVSIFPSAVECQTLRGTKGALDGLGSHLIPGSDASNPQYKTLYQSEDTLALLHAQNIVTFRTWPRLRGVYIRQAVQFVQDGDDWTYRPHRRVGDVIATLAYLELVRLVNVPRFTDPTTGTLIETEHKIIEDNVRGRIAAAMYNDNGITHIGGLEIISDRSINFKETRSVTVAINFITKDPAVTISALVNAVRTITE